jgi:hypothetical protein
MAPFIMKRMGARNMYLNCNVKCAAHVFHAPLGLGLTLKCHGSSRHGEGPLITYSAVLFYLEGEGRYEEEAWTSIVRTASLRMVRFGQGAVSVFQELSPHMAKARRWAER